MGPEIEFWFGINLHDGRRRTTQYTTIHAPDNLRLKWEGSRNDSATDEKKLHPKCPAAGGQQASSSPGWSCPVEPPLSSRVRLPSLGPDPAWPGSRTKPPTQDQSAPDKPPGIILPFLTMQSLLYIFLKLAFLEKSLALKDEPIYVLKRFQKPNISFSEPRGGGWSVNKERKRPPFAFHCPLSTVHCPGPCCFDPFSLWQKFPLSGMVDFRAVAVLAALAICGELQIPLSTSISRRTISQLTQIGLFVWLQKHSFRFH